jgi:hypothetical protein
VIRVTFDGGDAIARKLAELEKKARTKVGRAIGRDVANVLLPIMKQETRQRTGGLVKAQGSKVKAYRGGAVITIVVGPRTAIAFAKVSPRKVRRIKKNESVAAFKKAGTYYRPSRIAHLAGPQRKSRALQRTIARARGPVKNVFIRHMKALTNAR